MASLTNMVPRWATKLALELYFYTCWHTLCNEFIHFSRWFLVSLCMYKQLIVMEIILVLLGGYLLSKLFNGSSSKPKRRRRKSGFWSSGSSYSEYDAWRKSHGDENKLFWLPYKKEESLKTSWTCRETLCDGDWSPRFEDVSALQNTLFRIG